MVRMAWSIKEHAQFRGFPFPVRENQTQLINEIEQDPQREAFLFYKARQSVLFRKEIHTEDTVQCISQAVLEGQISLFSPVPTTSDT